MQITFKNALKCLTCQPAKRTAFQAEFVPDEAWDLIWRIWGSLAPEFIYWHSFLIIKPEAISRRLTWCAVDFVKSRGFAPVAAISIPLSRNAAHQIWRYQWNAATTDRVRLTNLVNAQGESLLLVLRDQSRDPVPAAVKLWRMKGSAFAERRTAEHLRTALRMHNRMLGFVHTPDEPADAIRELAILLDENDLSGLLNESLSAFIDNRDSPYHVRSAVEKIESCSVAHSIDPGEVAERLSGFRYDEGLRSLLIALQQGRRLDLAAVRGAFGETTDGGARWDFMTLAAELIAHDRPGVAPMLSARAVGEVLHEWSQQGESMQRKVMRG